MVTYTHDLLQGCPGIETRIPLLFNYGVLKDRITPQKFIELTATNPAKLYGMYPKKGTLLVCPPSSSRGNCGLPDSLCTVSPACPTQTLSSGIPRANLTRSSSRTIGFITMWIVRTFFHIPFLGLNGIRIDTPFEGMEFTNWPRYTLLRGKVMWANGELVGTPRDGRYLRRGPSIFADRFSERRKDPRRVATWLVD
jgi:dihydropyrimidinase